MPPKVRSPCARNSAKALAEEFSSNVAVKAVSFTWILSFTVASPALDVEPADELAGTASGVLLADDFGVWVSGCVEWLAASLQATRKNNATRTMFRIYTI